MPNFAKRVMILYGSLIIMLFVLLIVGAGLLLHAREKEHQEEMKELQRENKEHQEEMKELQRENDYLRDKVNQLSAHKLL